MNWQIIWLAIAIALIIAGITTLCITRLGPKLSPEDDYRNIMGGSIVLVIGVLLGASFYWTGAYQ